MKKHAQIDSASVSMPFTAIGSETFTDNVLGNAFWKRYVIGDVAQMDDGQPGSLTIEESNTLQHNAAERHISCDEKHVPLAIKFAAHLLERERQNHGIYMVHGNVISLGERAFSLIGGISGIGKTTLSSTAARHEWEWTSDEKFLMNESGEYLQGLGHILDDDKTREAAGIFYPTVPHERRNISAFIIPIVAQQNLDVHLYNENKATYHLYEELGRNITASRSIFPDYPSPLPSVDLPHIAARRYNCASALASRVPMYFAMGTSESILTWLEDTA